MYGAERSGRTNLHSKMHRAARSISSGCRPPSCICAPSSLQIFSSSLSWSGVSRLASLSAPRLVLGHLDPGFSFGRVGCMRSNTPFSCVIAGGKPLQACSVHSAGPLHSGHASGQQPHCKTCALDMHVGHRKRQMWRCKATMADTIQGCGMLASCDG